MPFMNDLIHGLYVHSREDNSPAVLTFSGAARIKGNPLKISPRDLELFIVNLNWLSDELISLRPLFPKIDKPAGPWHSAPKIPDNKQP